MKRITFLFTLMLLAFSTQGWAESRNGSDFEEEGNWYLMLEDFEGTAPIIMGTTKNGKASIGEESGKKFMKYDFKAYNSDEYMYVDISLPGGVLLSDVNFSELQFDIMYIDQTYQKDFKIKVGENNCEAADATEIGSFTSTNDFNQWFTKKSTLTLPSLTSFRLFLGGFSSNNAVVYIDNIRLKYNGVPTPTGPVAVDSVSLNKTKTTITVGGSEKLVQTVFPSNATNKTVTWESNNTDVATVDNDGTVHGVAAGPAIITVTTEDGGFTATCEVTVEETSSMNGKVYLDGENAYLMLEDFEGTKSTYGTTNGNSTASIEGDTNNKWIKYKFKNHGETWLYVSFELPTGKTLSSDFSELQFALMQCDGNLTYKDFYVKIGSSGDPSSATEIGKFHFDVPEKNKWETQTCNLSDKNLTDGQSIYLFLGNIHDNSAEYHIDKIRLKLANAGKCGDNALWVYDNNTNVLTISGEGATNDYNSSSDTPWQDKMNDIVSVVVEGGITSIGKHSFSDFSNVDNITFKTPNLNYIGENVFQSIKQNATITLKSNPTIANQTNKGGIFNLVLNDAEKPFMAATSENTYNNVTYTRNYTSSYSTTILPFAPGTVDGVTHYTISNATDNSVTFTTVDNPEANKPYLIGLTAAGEKEFSAEDVKIPANQTEVSTSTANWTMTGRYVTVVKKADDNAYGFSGGQLYRNTGNMTVNPFRAYFTTASSNAKAVMDVEFGNTPTAINNLENGSFEFNEVYNLNGVRQNSLQNGVNIVKMANGKTMKIILNK